MTASGLEVVVFVGLQASGKSTCYRCCFAATHDHISKDAWPNARHRQRRQLQLIDEALAAGRSVVVDNTNPAPVRDCLVRNNRREGRARVPDVAIFATAKRLRLPSTQEGFDRLRIARMTPDGTFELDEPAEGEASQAGGRARQRESR